MTTNEKGRLEMLKELWSETSPKTKLITVLILLILGSLLNGWYSTPPPTAGVVTAAPPAKAVAAVEKKEVQVAKLVVYDKKQVAKHINLPKEVEENGDEEVTGVSDVAASKAGVTVTTVVDKKTGVSRSYQEQKKQPFFGWGGETRIGADYVALGKSPAVNIHAQYEFIRIGNAYGHVRAEVEKPLGFGDKAEIKGMVGADYVW